MQYFVHENVHLVLHQVHPIGLDEIVIHHVRTILTGGRWCLLWEVEKFRA